MKNLFIIYCFFILSPAFSQNLKLEDLLLLQKKTHSEVKKYLVNKGWKIMHEHYSDEKKFGDIRFSFNNDSKDTSAASYLTFYYEGKLISQNRIEFEMLKRQSFDLYLSDFEHEGFKYEQTKKDLNQSTDIYNNNSVNIEATIMPVKNYYGKEQTFYTFLIIDKKFEKKKYY